MLFKIIPQSHCAVVERFGKPVRVAQSGLRFFIPVLDSLKNVAPLWNDATNKDGVFIELSEQINDTKPRECFSKDNVKVTVDCVYRWRITDPVKAIYEVDHLHKSLKETVLNEIRSLIGSRDLNEILSSRSQMSELVVTAISDVVRRWGVNVVGAEIQELTVDSATQDAMRVQMEAARRSEAMKLESEGEAAALLKKTEAEKQAAILRAQGECEAMNLLAQGEQQYVKTLSEVLGAGEAAKILLAQKMLRTYSEISNGAANKVFMPTPSGNPMAMLEGSAGER